MENEYKSGLSRKERHIIQMGYEDDELGLKNENEFYVYQNKIRAKINGTLTDSLLIIKNSETVFNLNDELIKNKELLKELKTQIEEFLESI